jgi:predicted transcriptional regulator
MSMNASMPRVRLHALMVPLLECITVQVGALSEDAVANLEQHKYDDAPVLAGSQVVGITNTHELRRCLSQGLALTTNGYRPLSQESVIATDDGETVPADLLLQLLADNHSVLVAKGGPDERGQFVGFVTMSDLNRHAMRSCLYDALALLESKLARLIQQRYGDVWEWIRFLNEEAQVRVLGYWELTRRQDLDVGPIAATTLTYLLRILASDKRLLKALGFNSRSKFETLTGHIPWLRNSVMHPVRPLVLNSADTSSVLSTLQGVVELTNRILSLDPSGAT